MRKNEIIKAAAEDNEHGVAQKSPINNGKYIVDY